MNNPPKLKFKYLTLEETSHILSWTLKDTDNILSVKEGTLFLYPELKRLTKGDNIKDIIQDRYNNFIKENNKTDNEKQNICMNEINEDEEPIASISEKTECLICLEGFEESNGTKLPCGHFCCENCLFNYLKTEIESAKVAKIKCFIKDCEYTISEAFILSKLSNDHNLTDKYKIFKQRAEIFLSKDKKFCPEPDCNSYLQESANKYVQCESGHKYCYVCLKPWHGSEPCDEELDKDFQI